MAKVMGIGTFYVIMAELALILSNYAIHIAIARFLGPEYYGSFGVLMSIYLISRAFLGTGIPRAVSKHVSESKLGISAIYKSAMKLQLVAALFFAFIFVLFSNKIALLLNDPSLSNYIVLLGVIVVPLSIISLYILGFLNGLRMFKKQAIINSIFLVLRTLLTFLFLFMGFKLWGVLFAYLLSILGGIYICTFVLRKIKTKKNHFNLKKVIKFALPLTIASLSITMIRNLNVLFIKSLIVDNIVVGFYTVAVTLSNLPYMVFIGLSLTLMPSISRSTAKKDFKLTNKYLVQSTRYLLLLLLPVVGLMLVTAKPLIGLFFSSAYYNAYPSLIILLIASTFLVLFRTLTSALIGYGKPKIEMYIVIVMLALMSILSFILIPHYGIVGAAISTLIVSVLAFLFALIFCTKNFKTVFDIKSTIKIVFAAIVISLIGYFFNFSGFFLVITYGAMFSLYAMILFILRELKKDDLSMLRNIFKQRTS